MSEIITSASAPSITPEPAAPAPAVRVPAPRWARWMRRASWGLMGAAVLIVGYVGTLIGYQSVEQRRLASAWEQANPAAAIHDVTRSGSSIDQAAVEPHMAPGQSMARLSMPSVGFGAIVTEGRETGVLSTGPGHDEHTDYPGEGGLILMDNHNGFSTSWDNLHQGDQIVVEMPYGRFHYTITQRFTMPGDDQRVVTAHYSTETLVLMTCWPLWQGSFAKDRLVLEATPVVKP